MQPPASASSFMLAILAAAGLAAAAQYTVSTAPEAVAQKEEAADTLYIVQGKTVGAARQSVRDVGARVERDLEGINAVSAILLPKHVERLTEAGLRVYKDLSLGTAERAE